MADLIIQTPKYDEPIESIFPYALGNYPLTMLDPDPVTRLHYHSVYELGICVSGHGKCIFTDTSVSYEEGDATFFVPYQAHFSRCEPNDISQWHWFYFDLDATFASNGFSPEYWHSLGEISSGRCGVLSHKEFPMLCNLIKEIVQSANDISLPNRNVTVSLLIAQFLVGASRNSEDGKTFENSDHSNQILRILPAIKYIRRHYSDSLSIVKLAGLCNMSQSTFRRHFHAALNMSPYDYIMNVRLKIAAHYLSNSEIPIALIAQNCGIVDSANFTHHFVNKYHLTPQKYRKEHMQ